ncbi:MAG: TIR domain-containing protein [Pseudomonadota bacterium]
MPDQIEVFISYNRSQKNTAEIINGHLETYAVSTFFDQSDISIGDDFADRIDGALRSCDVVLSLWSETYFESKWCVSECRFAMNANKIIPVAIENISAFLPPFDLQILNYHHLAGWDGSSDHREWMKVLSELEQHLGRSILPEKFSSYLERISSNNIPDVIQAGNIQINTNDKTVYSNKGRLALTGKEYQMLYLLMCMMGKTVTKSQFLNYLYGDFDEPELKIIDVFIAKLRKKIAPHNDGNPMIETVWGRGYTIPVNERKMKLFRRF